MSSLFFCLFVFFTDVRTFVYSTAVFCVRSNIKRRKSHYILNLSHICTRYINSAGAAAVSCVARMYVHTYTFLDAFPSTVGGDTNNIDIPGMSGAYFH